MTLARGTEWQTRLAAFAARFRTETNLPGISLATTVGGERASAAAGIGRDGEPLDGAARYEIGCGVQLPLALLVLELWRTGRLALDAPLAEYLTELRGSTGGDEVRVAHLLSHTAGFRVADVQDAATRAFDRAGLLSYVRAAPQLFPPGAVFSFDHSGIALLGEIVRRVVGRPVETAVHERILEPLGLPRRTTDAAGACPGRPALDGHAGCLGSGPGTANASPLGEAWQPAFSRATFTLDELLVLAEAIIDRLPRATVDRLTASAMSLPAPIGGPLRKLLPCAFASGVARFRDGFCGSSGLTHGQCVAVRFDVERRTGIAVGVNAAVPYLRDLALAVLARELGASAPPPERPGLPVPLPELAGSYLGPGASWVDARLEGERLACVIGRRGSALTLRFTVSVDADHGPTVLTPAADLALAFFRVPQDGGVGLMLGLNAYKRVAPAA